MIEDRRQDRDDDDGVPQWKGERRRRNLLVPLIEGVANLAIGSCLSLVTVAALAIGVALVLVLR